MRLNSTTAQIGQSKKPITFFTRFTSSQRRFDSNALMYSALYSVFALGVWEYEAVDNVAFYTYISRFSSKKDIDIQT
jgi:hypothetical protein